MSLIANVKKQNHVDPEHKICINVCTESYKSEHNKKPAPNLDNYTLHSFTPTIVVYESSEQIIIGCRGTVTVADIATDIMIARNKLSTSARFKKDLKFVNTVLNTVLNTPLGRTNNNICFTGHSLGGAIATQMVLKFPKSRGVIFNSGCSPQIKDEYKQLDIYNYTTKDDVISIFCYNKKKTIGKYKNNIIVDKCLDNACRKMMNAHKLTSFLYMNRQFVLHF